MKNPSEMKVGDSTGAHMERFHVAPVSHMWVRRLVEIDSQWNPKHWSEALFQNELSSRMSRVRGLFAGSQLVGYLIAHVVCDEAHIVSLGVDTCWRARGGGRLLLRDFLRSALVEGVVDVSLDVRVSNLSARKLYEESGFALVGIRRNYYSDNGEDALTMRYTAPGKHHRIVNE